MIQSVLTYLIYTPSINIPLGFGDIETFPWALLFCLSPKLVLDRVYLYLLVAFGLSAAITVAIYGNAFAVIRSYFALLNGSLIFFRIMGTDRPEFFRLIQAMLVVFFLNIFISWIQYIGWFPAFIEPYYRMLVPRFTSESIGAGRGVGGLYAEPAYSSYAMHFMFAFMVLWWRLNPFERKGAIAFLGMLAFDLFLNKSATGTAFLVVLFVSFLDRKTLGKFVLASLVFFAGVLWLSEYMEEPPRAVDLVNNILFTWDTDDIYMTLMNESGHRVFSILSAYKYGLVHWLGGGIGSWPVSSVIAMEAMGIESFEIYYFLEFNDGFFLGIRPTAFAAGLFLEVGIIGCAAYCFTFFRHTWHLPYRADPFWRATFNLFLFNFFLIGTIGDPMPYITLAMAYLAMTKFQHQSAHDPSQV
jgi:hypothetical protein